MDIFCKRLSELRKLNGLSQAEFAEKIGVSKGIISLWENGHRFIRADYLREIAKTFGESTDYLLGLTDC